jgi:predicted dehydrogenase
MAKKFKVGVVGAGGIFRGAHLPGWMALPDCEMWALCDVSPAAVQACADELKSKWGVEVPKERRFTDFKKMFKAVADGKLELDMVDVCTPNTYHHGPTIAAFDAGCHVIVEKPMTIAARYAEQMTAAGKKAKKMLMIAQSMRFGPEGLLMKRIADSGALGKIYWGEAVMLRPRGVPAWGLFIDKNASAGGPIYDIGVHVLDLTLHCMGFPKPLAVSAGAYLKLSNKPSVMRHDPKKYTVPDDSAAALIHLEGGITIVLLTSWALNIPAHRGNVVVCGDKGGLQLDPFTLIREEFGALTNVTIQENPFSGIASHAEEVRQFVEAIKAGKPSPVPGEQALKTQKILDAIYESGKRGREVVLK